MPIYRNFGDYPGCGGGRRGVDARMVIRIGPVDTVSVKIKLITLR
jgi:hypothetical protein